MPDKSYGTSDNALHILLQAPVPVLPYRSVLQLPLLHRGRSGILHKLLLQALRHPLTVPVHFLEYLPEY